MVEGVRSCSVVRERVLVKDGEATPWLLEAESVPELAVHESRL